MKQTLTKIKRYCKETLNNYFQSRPNDPQQLNEGTAEISRFLGKLFTAEGTGPGGTLQRPPGGEGGVPKHTNFRVIKGKRGFTSIGNQDFITIDVSVDILKKDAEIEIYPKIYSVDENGRPDISIIHDVIKGWRFKGDKEIQNIKEKTVKNSCTLELII